MKCPRIGLWFVGLTALAGAAGAADDAARSWDGATEETAASPEAELGSPWSLGYADFLPQSTGSDDCFYDSPSEGNTGFVTSLSPTTVCCLVAGVSLPDGATVTSIIFYLHDESDDDVTLSLRRKRIDDETASVAMGTVTTSGSEAGVRFFLDLTITSGLIDNRNYTYFVSTDTCLDEGTFLTLVSGQLFFSEGS